MNDSAEDDVKLIAADRYKKSWSRWRDFLFQDQGSRGEIPNNNAVDERQAEEEEARDSWSLCYRFNQELKGKS